MPYFRDPQSKLHFLDDRAFSHMLPDGCVEITDEEAALLRAPSRAQAEENAWVAIKAARDRRRFTGGVNVGTNWFQSTSVATSEYNSLALLSAGLPDNAVLREGWRTMNGAAVDMTPALVRQILAAGFATVAAIDDAAQAHKAAMMASAAPAAYDFSGGWPTMFGE